MNRRDYRPLESRERTMTTTNTRDNLVVYALREKECPRCGRPVKLEDKIKCGCGFSVGEEELRNARESQAKW